MKRSIERGYSRIITTFDLLLAGGRLVDGTGGPSRIADVGIVGGRIVAIEDDLTASTPNVSTVIDASGKVVAPGFIDIHTHSDISQLIDPRAESQIRQGVTTEAIGQCGISLAPCTHETRGGIFSSLGMPEVGNWTSYGELLQAMDEARIATNVVGMVGHAALRQTVMGVDAPRAATDVEVAEMVKLLEESLGEGAFGFTTGLEYHPGKMATYDELAALCSAAARADAIYATHSRNRDRRYFVGFGEALDVARESGVRLQISHINPKYGRPDRTMSNTLQMIEWARDEGIDVAMDMMPTNWNHTAAAQLLPVWSFGLSTDEMLALMQTTDGRKRLRDNPLPMWQLAVEERWDRIRLLACSANRELVGQTIADIAELRSASSGWDALFDLMVEDGQRFKGVMLTGEAFAEEDNVIAMQHPLCSIESDTMAMATDGPFAGRTFGLVGYNWVSRFLGHYVRDSGVLSLEEAVRRITALPAERLGLGDRGRLELGAAADVTVFDLDGVRDNSSFEDPAVYADGFDHVIVNGVPAFTEGQRLAEHAGQVLRRN